MRLFTAIDLAPDVAKRLNELSARLRPLAPIRWSRVENLHITTKFIGEWPQDRLEEVNEALSSTLEFDPIPLEIRGLGWFPNPHQPRIFWAAVHGPDSLLQLARTTEESLNTIGIAKENRDYHPHLTLARIENRSDLSALRRAIASLEDTDFGYFEASSFHLYLSETGPGGSNYTKLSTFIFRGNPAKPM